MADTAGEPQTGLLRLRFDCSVEVAFQGSSISSNGGLLLHRELDDALGLTDMAAALVADPRTGAEWPTPPRRPAAVVNLPVFGRLADYEDVNDAEQLIKTVARPCGHGRYAIFQRAAAAVPREVFSRILGLINTLRGPPATAVSA